MARGLAGVALVLSCLVGCSSSGGRRSSTTSSPPGPSTSSTTASVSTTTPSTTGPPAPPDPRAAAPCTAGQAKGDRRTRRFYVATDPGYAKLPDFVVICFPNPAVAVAEGFTRA